MCPPTSTGAAIHQAIEDGDFDTVESAWLELLDRDPVDISELARLARALVGAGESERAHFLLQMADEALAERRQPTLRWRLLMEIGDLLIEPDELHLVLEERLRQLFPEHSAFSALVDHVGLHRATGDLERLREKAEHLRQLLRLDVGTVVLMPDRGAGEIVGVNAELKSFRVELGEGATLTVGFRGAPGVLEPLPPQHVLRARVERPAELARLAAEQPAELLRLTLTSFDRPLSAAEIRNALGAVIEEGAWSRWWSEVRRHPQVVQEGGGRATYRWSESVADAEETLWKEFEDAPPRQRIELLRRTESRSEELAGRMRNALEAQASDLERPEPGTAFEIALALEKTGGEAASELLLRAPEPRALLAGIQDRSARQEAYRRIARLREDATEVLTDRLDQESDPRALDTVVSLLATRSPAAVTRFVDEILAQPRKRSAAFLWLLEAARERDELLRHSPSRLFRHLLQALEWDEFRSQRNLVEQQLDSGGAAARLIPLLESDRAQQAAAALARAPIEEYRKRSLANALELRFPELAQQREQPLYALPESIAAKRHELDQLREVEIPANRRAIQEAREMGDLRENFEYKAARQRHEYLAARLAALQGELARARPIEIPDSTSGQVRIGSTVELADDAGEQTLLTILGPWESDPEAGIVSHESEAGELLLGRRVGERIELPQGSFTILAIIPLRPDDGEDD